MYSMEKAWVKVFIFSVILDLSFVVGSIDSH
jgi:hypothetical protein